MRLCTFAARSRCSATGVRASRHGALCHGWCNCPSRYCSGDAAAECVIDGAAAVDGLQSIGEGRPRTREIHDAERRWNLFLHGAQNSALEGSGDAATGDTVNEGSGDGTPHRTGEL